MQGSNVLKGVLDTFHEEGSMMGSLDLGHFHHPTSPKRSTFNKNDSATGNGVKSNQKISVESGRPYGSTVSPRNIHNSSHMQKAAIMNTMAKENSPSNFGKISVILLTINTVK